MKFLKLTLLQTKLLSGSEVDETADEGIINLTDIIAGQIAGGTGDLACTNNGCTNNMCTGGTNGMCKNMTCNTNGQSNDMCMNTGCTGTGT